MVRFNKRLISIFLALAMTFFLCIQTSASVYAAPIASPNMSIVVSTPAPTPTPQTAVTTQTAAPANGDEIDYSQLSEEADDDGVVDPNDADVVPFAPRTGVIISDNVNVRSMPDADADPVLLLGVGTEITIKSVIDDDWYYMEKGYDNGYIKKEFVYSPEDNTEGTVNGIDINFRAEPSTDAKVLGTLKFGQKVEIVGFQDGWFNVRTEDGKDGYLIRSLIAVKGIDYINNNAIQEGDRGSVVSTIQKQLNKLGFFDFTVTGEFGKITKEAVQKFQKIAKVEADGVVGPETLRLIEEGKITNPNPGTAATSSAGASISSVEMLDWWKGGSSFYARGTVATITDVRTGKHWKEKRTGGTNHADSEPLTAADTAIMKSVVGGSWTWNRRPVLVTINGRTSAASMNVMPHAFKRLSVANNFKGHHCIHFLNSRTHGSNRMDAAHQAAIREAYNSRKK